MADRKISDLTALTTPAAGDYLPIVDISEVAASSKNKRITIEELLRGAPDGTAAAPSIGFESDPNTGIYSPGADQLAISTNGVGRLFVDASGNVILGTTSILSGASGRTLQIGTTTDSASTLQFAATTTGNSYIQFGDGGSPESYAGYLQYTHTDNALLFGTNKQERLRITSAGLVGIGTSSPGFAVDISAPNDTVVRSRTNGNTSAGFIGSTNNGTNNWFFGSRKDATGGSSGTDRFNLLYDANAFLTVTTGGNVGIGTTSPNSVLQVNSGTNLGGILVGFNASSSNFYDADLQVFRTGNGTERARIDSSGRLLVGTSSARSDINRNLNIEALSTNAGITIVRNNADNAPPVLEFGKTRAASVGGNTAVVDGDGLGMLRFYGANGTDLSNEGARISAEVDGTPFSSGDTTDLPSRLVFSTTADGASSPTERFRVTSAGDLLFGTTSTAPNNSSTETGIVLNSSFAGNGFLGISRGAEGGLAVNRTIDDGVLVYLQQAGTVEGTISVSGTTVSYNGAHLSRWSQLPSGAERAEILRGSVLSNIDEMCEWGEEDNEQLNRMKVSDIEGDKNVSGVFQGWDDDDDTYTNDFYCAMTGDFIIRIAQGVTVERGDLLMSAGDGTAKPQDDDIIRSKTIAKVTSTNVSCTYEDGSYCVPCVLMAC